MNTHLILSFLRDIQAHNERGWFQDHRDMYLAARDDFERGVEKAILRITGFDPSIAHVTVKDTTYRFYRDTRFSPDKSPYKTHLGAYICARGKKSFHGGYYIHLEPGNCMLACGNYWLPTNILTACRNEIMANTEEWLRCVANPQFLRLFGKPGGQMEQQQKGFGLTMLKTSPAGFPRDYEQIAYLRMKDYCCWHKVADDFFEGDRWLDEMERVFKGAKPMVDFVNLVIDDYE